MRTLYAGAAALAVITAAGAANAASVEIKDAVARVSVIPEARNDVKVEIVRANPNLPLQVRSLGDRTIVDGDLDRRIGACREVENRPAARVRNLGWVEREQMPVVVIRVPRDADVSAGGAVFGAIDRSASLSFANAGCGDWLVADVQGPMKISLAGSGDVRTGRSGSAKLRLAGSGDIALQAVRGGLDANIAGSGDVNVASISGPLDVHIAGSGDVHIAGGRATAMTVAVAGSGGVDFKGAADSLKARIAGSGDVHVRAVKGEVSKAIVGSGDVIIGD